MTDEYIRRKDAVKIAEKYGLTNGSVLGRHTGLADCIAYEAGIPRGLRVQSQTGNVLPKLRSENGWR